MAEKKKKTKKEVEVKKTRKRPDRSAAMNPHLAPGEMGRYISHSMVAWDLPPLDLESDEAVSERISMYFERCADDDMKPTITGLALYLGVDRKTLYNWVSGSTRSNSRLLLIKKAYEIVENMMESYMTNGKINPVSGIFLMKNHFGYQDKQDIAVTPINPLGDESGTPEQLQEKYLDIVDVQEPTDE